MTTERSHGKAAFASVWTAMWLWLATLLVGPVLAGEPGEPWQADLGQDHPLVGRIWDVGAGRFIDITTLAERLKGGRFVLLGEKHDNPDHHRLQAWALSALVAAGRRPAVGFEMFTIDYEPAIARHLAAHPSDVKGLADVVNWSSSGWPDWGFYQPIAAIAVQAGLPLVACNIPPSMVRALMHGGLATLDAELVSRLHLDRPLPREMHTAMAAEIADAHCGSAPPQRVEAMVEVQRARDAQMAASLAAAGKQDGAVLIAGAGHVRNDYGVPVHLADRAPGATIVALAFVEISAQHTEPAAYAMRFGSRTLPFDYVWFTPRVDNLDPCEKFKKQLQRLRKPR